LDAAGSRFGFKEFRDFAVKPDGANYVVTAKAKTSKLPYERIEMLVTPDYQIQRLVIAAWVLKSF